MRTTRGTTIQTTCDGGDGLCQEYVISAFFDSVPLEQRAARHRQFVAMEGWVDHEGRDYCLDHIPAAATAPTP